MYRKEIIYIGLYKKENRIGSAGFLKVESGERDSRLYLKAQNVPLGISGRFPVRVYNGSGWKEINGLTIRDGGGIWGDSIDGSVNGPIIQVMLSGGYMLEGRSKSASRAVVQKNTVESENVSVEQENTGLWSREEIRQGSGMQNQDAEQPEIVNGTVRDIARMDTVNDAVQADVVHDTMRADVVQTDAVHNGVHREAHVNTVQNISREDAGQGQRKVIVTEELKRRSSEEAAEPQNHPNYNLKEDKWEQLLDTYENIHPYGDERVYVKLEPKDFVILQSKYQHLVNNSFLLHGFYNYRYIILGKEKNFYLGVPGVFYEREKMVAQMFGFEAFECPGGNVRAGEFGYYLRKVEL